MSCTCDGCRGDYPAAVLEAWAEQRRRLEELPQPLFGCFCDECRAAIAAIELAREQAAEPEPLSPHIGGYRTSPRPQAMVPRRAPWWRLAWWWVRGGPSRLEAARRRRDPLRELRQKIDRVEAKLAALSGLALRRYDEDLTQRMDDARTLQAWSSVQR